MADPVDSSRPDDGALVAYLDGELDASGREALEARLAADADLRARLDHLKRGSLPFAETYDVLLAAAPQERLDAILAHCADVTTRPPIRRRTWRLAAIAAALAVFVIGAAAGYLVPLLTGITEPVKVAERPGWRQVVAEYMTFMTPETLSIIPESPAILADELSAVGQKVALDLTADKLALPHVYLKRAQLFEFRGMPLAQLAYLSRDSGPMAFCIIANGRPDAPPAFEQREGFNIVFWTSRGLGYMLIGKAARETLEAFAGDLAARVS